MKAFVKAFEDIGYRHDWMSVFQDLLTISICVFSYGKYEEEYREIINRYPKSDHKLFQVLFTEMIKAYDEGSSSDGDWTDILGDMYMEIGSRSTHQMRGQFFTPPCVCDMMAQMTINSDEQVNINDCACGSGRTLISASRLRPNNRFNMFFVGQDVDMTVCKMAVINFIMFGMKGVVINMDTLSMEVNCGWRVFLPEVGMGVVKLTKEQCLSFILKKEEVFEEKKQAPIIQLPVVEKYEQLRLFV